METKTTTGFTAEELALLSDEERAAIEAPDDDAEDLKAIAREGDDPGPGDDDDDDDDNAEAKAAEKAAAKAAKEEAEEKAAAKDARDAELKKMKPAEREAAEAADAEAAAKAAVEEKARVEAEKKAATEAAAKAAREAEEKEDVDAPRQRLPRYQAKPVEKYDEQMKSLDDAEAKALEVFQAGDSTIAELLKVQRECDAKRADLREQKTRFEMATEFNNTNSMTEWQNDVQDFIASVAQKEGIDYNKPLLNAALDTAVKALAADKANAERATQWFLRTAHKQVMAELGLVKKEPTAAEKEAAEKAAKEAAAKLKGRKPGLALVPRVGDLPSAGEDDPAGGDPEFVHLDNLTGQEFEDALAAMPVRKQEKYLRQQSG